MSKHHMDHETLMDTLLCLPRPGQIFYRKHDDDTVLEIHQIKVVYIDSSLGYATVHYGIEGQDTMVMEPAHHFIEKTEPQIEYLGGDY